VLGNLSSRSRGFNSLPVKASQPAGSESCMWRWQHHSSAVCDRRCVAVHLHFQDLAASRPTADPGHFTLWRGRSMAASLQNRPPRCGAFDPRYLHLRIFALEPGRSPRCHDPCRCISLTPSGPSCAASADRTAGSVVTRSSGFSRRILPRAPTREHTANIASRSPLPTCSSWPMISISPKPALSRMPRTCSGLANANGPGASGS
jgi:hypothetical protein